MRISDWSSDVCSSDLKSGAPGDAGAESRMGGQRGGIEGRDAAPATGHALLPQEGVGLIPQAAKGGAAALRRHHVDVEVPGGLAGQIGRASCRERVCQYV